MPTASTARPGTDPPVPRPRLGLPAAAEEPALAKAGGNLTARIGSRQDPALASWQAPHGGNYFEAVALTGKRVSTKIGIIRDPGHAEPWIIAMSAKPGYLTTLEITPSDGASSRCSPT